MQSQLRAGLKQWPCELAAIAEQLLLPIKPGKKFIM